MKYKLHDHSMPRRHSAVGRLIGRSYLKLTGWGLAGAYPSHKKIIIAVAPHTSNWDFMHGIACVLAYDLKVTYLGKHTLFKGPLGVIMRWLGGVPVVRHDPQNLIGDMAHTIIELDEVMLALSPEGTRSKVKQWKTGFLRLSAASGVPIIPMYIDGPSKRLGFMDEFHTTGDLQADLERFKLLFKPYQGINPENE